MKFLDILKEEITDKQRKKTQTIHKILRKGVITLKTSGNRYRYELPEDFIFDTRGIYDISIKFVFFNNDIALVRGGLALPLKIWKIEDGKKDEYVNELLSAKDLDTICYGDEFHIDSEWGTEYLNVKNKVKLKYSNFNINVIMTTPSDTVMVNESLRYTEDDITIKDRKKAKLIYDTFKVGKFKSDNDEGIVYRYTLPDEYYISIDDESGDIIIVLTMNPEKQIQITAIFDGEREIDITPTYDILWASIKKKINEKFEKFDIQIVF